MTREQHFQAVDENLTLAHDQLRQQLLRGYFGLGTDVSDIVRNLVAAYRDLEDDG